MLEEVELAKRIKELRKLHGYTQEGFAVKMGCDYKYLQKIESKSPPNVKLETLEKMSKAFNLDVSKLLDF